MPAMVAGWRCVRDRSGEQPGFRFVSFRQGLQQRIDPRVRSGAHGFPELDGAMPERAREFLEGRPGIGDVPAGFDQKPQHGFERIDLEPDAALQGVGGERRVEDARERPQQFQGFGIFRHRREIEMTDGAADLSRHIEQRIAAVGVDDRSLGMVFHPRIGPGVAHDERILEIAHEHAVGIAQRNRVEHGLIALLPVVDDEVLQLVARDPVQRREAVAAGEIQEFDRLPELTETDQVVDLFDEFGMIDGGHMGAVSG